MSKLKRCKCLYCNNVAVWQSLGIDGDSFYCKEHIPRFKRLQGPPILQKLEQLYEDAQPKCLELTKQEYEQYWQFCYGDDKSLGYYGMEFNGLPIKIKGDK